MLSNVDHEIKISYQSQSVEKDAVTQHLEEILKELISDESLFEDHADFLLWAEESLPFIHWQKHPSADGKISIYFLSWSSSKLNTEFFFITLKRKLSAAGEVSRMSFEYFDFSLKENLHKKLSLAEVKLSPKTAVGVYRILGLLPNLVEELLLEIKSPFYGQYLVDQTKSVLVQDRIAKFRRRFHSKMSEQIFEEAKIFFAIAEPKFIKQRSCELLSRLIISQYFIRKSFLKALANESASRHVFCRILLSHLSSPFASKRVAGIFIAINFLHKYDIFTEEHILRALQRLGLDVVYIPNGSYSLQRHGESFKFLYLEIEKRNEEFFSFKEYKQLRSDLEKALKNSVERLQPSVFMINNEEEIIKNILLLNREIRSPSDLAQVMIHFEEQTDKDICFLIILVYVGNHDLLLSLNTSLHQNAAVYQPRWTQVVQHLKKKYPVHAHIFKLQLSKTQDLLRSDGSLDFYAARQKASKLLNQAIGEFRDYNGGIILKQGETLAKFKQLSYNYPSEILENFFYSLTPLEIQATIPLSNLSVLFELFLEGKNSRLDQPYTCFVKFVRKDTQAFCMLQTRDLSLADVLKASLNALKPYQNKLISTQLVTEERLSLGYIFEHEAEFKHAEFMNILQREVETWKKRVSNIKTLRLAVPFGLRPLDPRIQTDEETKNILKMLFEGLMRINAHGKVELGVAKKVKISPDKKKYLFELRLIHWSNGMQVVADDFIYAWKTLLSPHFKAPSAYLFYPIKNARSVKEGRLPPESLGVRAINNNTLEIDLEYPVPYFLELLAQPQFSPINPAVDRSQPFWPYQEAERYVCNGAFLLGKNHLTQGYELVKNLSYHNISAISLDKISIKNVQASEIREMFLRDEIDWLGFPTGTVDISSLPLEHGETLVLPNDSLYWYVFNTQCFPFNNTKIRRALAYAVDRAYIMQNIPPGHWPAFSILPFQHSRATLMHESKKKGIALFEEALLELGIDRKSFPPLILLHPEGKVRNSIAKIIRQEWEETFGIRSQIETYSWNETFNKLTEGNFQICGLNWISLIDDPSYTLQIFHSTSRFINFPRWKNDEYEQLLERGNREKKLSKRLHYCALAEEIILQEVPVIPLIRSLPCSVKKNRVEMFSHSCLKSWDFKWASIQSIQNKE